MPDIKTKSQTKIRPPRHRESAVILVAAGRGSRAGTAVPKQYFPIAGKALITHTLNSIKQAMPDALLVVVINPDDRAMFVDATKGIEGIICVHGGATRQESVYAGLKALEKQAPTYVLVHDAARPFLTAELVARLMDKLKSGTKAVVPALPVTDTLKRTKGGIIAETVDRTELYSVQTPQAFSYNLLLSAHVQAQHTQYTDDAAVVEAAGQSVEFCLGDEQNFKITRPEDFMKAEAMLMNACADIRVGSGFDVHAFEVGHAVTLCGIEIPFNKKLKGHSDADVGLHAITDAVLSAIAAGDIGTHFPPSDPQWRGAESHIFLRRAAELVTEKGGIISHIAVTLICEKPKIGPHVAAMRARVSAILAISEDRVSVQATTTEQLGFTGREEGIAAQATATVRLPFGELP